MSQDTNAPAEVQPQADVQEPVVVKFSPEELTRKLQSTSSEAKKYRQELADAKAQLEAARQAELQRQGKFEEIAKGAAERAAQAEKQRQEDRARFAIKVLKTEAKTEAARLGCVDEDALLHLIDVTQVGIDDDYNVDRQSLRMLIENEAKNRAYLFQRAAPQVKYMAQGSGTVKQKSLTEMTASERIAYVKSLR